MVCEESIEGFCGLSKTVLYINMLKKSLNNLRRVYIWFRFGEFEQGN